MKLTNAQRQEIEQELLQATPGAHGLQSKLAKRYGVFPATVQHIKDRLYGQRMFFSPRYQGYIGKTSDGGQFLVEQAAWEESIRDGMRVDGWDRGMSEEINLDPDNWEPCIDINPGVRLHIKHTRSRGGKRPRPIHIGSGAKRSDGQRHLHSL